MEIGNMTCYENMRKKNKTDNYDRLQSYFQAIEQDKTDEYHKKHGRGDKHKKYF